jgi:hypothetical protein
VGRAPPAAAGRRDLGSSLQRAGVTATARAPRANLVVVFERFTERARRVIVLAQEETLTLKHDYLGTEHILLGLLREQEGLAGRVLRDMGITLAQVRADVARIVGTSEQSVSGPRQVPFTPEAKTVLERTLREAVSLGHNFIGTEHLLLGLVGDRDSVGTRVLLGLDADPQKIRDDILLMLASRRPVVHDVDRSWLDFTPAEAFDLAMRLVALAHKITFEVRRHTDEEPTFRVSCQLVGNDDVLRELVALETVGIRAILDGERTVRLGHLEPPSEPDTAGA